MRLSLALLPFALTGCQTGGSYAPPPRLAAVESVEVEVRRVQGRPKAYAVVRGHFSSNAAQFAAPKQWRDERDRLHLAVREQTPRGAALLPDGPEPAAFQTRIPVELLGLRPGTHTLVANGVETTFEIPPIRAESYEPASTASRERTEPAIRLVDEFIPIEESPYAVANTPSVPVANTPPTPVATPVAPAP